jgi:hypothetical protein
MKFVQYLAALVCCLMASAADASDASSGAITQPQATQNGAVIFVHSGTRTTPPSCGASYPTRWAIDASTPQGQSQLSVLLTAYALHKSISIHGTGACSIWGDTETVAILLINE